MNYYLIECDEYLFLSSFHTETFPSHYPFQSFSVHDTLVFVVDARIAGVAVVESEDKKLRFHHVLEQANRLPILRVIRSLLVNEWGIEFGQEMRNFTPISTQTGEELVAVIMETPSDVGYYLTNGEELLEQARHMWEHHVKKQQKEQIAVKFEGLIEDGKQATIPTTDHAKAQFYLKEIANITGCGVWTASNDKNRMYKGDKLGEDDLASFPAFHLDEEVQKRIQLIDTIWFQGDFPVSCFEVETSTSIYSGLLRMSDLVTVMPGINCKIYIVAPNERKKKVMNEMNRPVFRAIGLPHLARFISIESLELLYQKIKGLDGFVSPQVVDAISLNVEELALLESF